MQTNVNQLIVRAKNLDMDLKKVEEEIKRKEPKTNVGWNLAFWMRDFCDSITKHLSLTIKVYYFLWLMVDKSDCGWTYSDERLSIPAEERQIILED